MRTVPSDKNTQIYVARFPSRTRNDDLEEAFKKFGKIKDLVMKGQYAFIDYEDAKDAEDAIQEMDNKEFDGVKLIVEASVGRKKFDSGRDRVGDRDRGGDRGGDRERGRGPQLKDSCFNCGKSGHWANECREERSQRRDTRELTCFKCGKTGHKRIDCNNRSGSRSRSNSSRSASPRRRRSPSSSHSRDRKEKRRSHRRSRTPERRRRSPDNRNRSRSRSPKTKPEVPIKAEEKGEEKKSID